jgi:hypothetical protein
MCERAYLGDHAVGLGVACKHKEGQALVREGTHFIETGNRRAWPESVLSMDLCLKHIHVTIHVT